MSIHGKPGGEPPALSNSHEKTKKHVVPDWIVRHIEHYQRDPESGHYWDGRAFGGHEKTPSLLLTMRGRKTGRLLTRPLIYGQEGDRYVVVGSKGGAAQNPSWIFNIEADPNVVVQVVRDRFPAVATIVGGAERQRLWDLMVKVYPPYPGYQKRTEREIPVVVLTRR